MALQWDIRGVKNFQKLCWVPDPTIPENERNDDNMRQNPYTWAIIWLTISVDMNEITEKNVDEFYWRMRFMERFKNVTMLNAKTKSGRILHVNPTYKMLKAHIGLKTNASNNTRAKFLARMVRSMESQMDDVLLAEVRRAADRVEKKKLDEQSAKRLDRKDQSKPVITTMI